MDFIKGFSAEQYAGALESWGWLDSPAVQQELLIDLADAALQRGLAPGADEILDFTQSPVLGGPIDPGNLQVMDFVVGVNIAGQIHAQTTNLAAGIPISGVEVKQERRGLFGRRKKS